MTAVPPPAQALQKMQQAPQISIAVVPDPPPGSSPADPADAAALTTVLDGALEGVLARFKHPKRYVVADTLPRNAMSKVQKATLRTQHDDLFS